MFGFAHTKEEDKYKVEIPEPISAKELLETDWEEPDFLIPNLLPVGLTFLAGRPKIGKSWLALQIAVAVGTGGEILGEEASKGPVLYLAYEDNPRRLSQRLIRQGITTEQTELIEFFPNNIALEEFYDLDLNKGDKLIQLAHDKRLVIIDTFARAFHGRYNDNNVMTELLSPVHKLAQDTGTSILLVDHQRKPKMIGANSIDDLIGGTAKAAIADTVWGLYEKSKGFYLEITGRDIEGKNIKVRFDQETCTWIMDDEAECPRLGELQDKILNYLKEKGEASCTKIALDLGCDRSNVFKAAKKLAEKGLIKPKWIGRNLIFYIPDITDKEVNNTTQQL